MDPRDKREDDTFSVWAVAWGSIDMIGLVGNIWGQTPRQERLRKIETSDARGLIP